MTIRAYAYAGGIVGYCEPQTKMYVKDCLNAGGFDRPAEDTFPDSKLKTGVDMVSYLRAQKYTDAAKALSDELGSGELRVSIIGGVVGVNGENHVIDHCGNTGTMNGLNAMGGVVGLNEGHHPRLHALRQHGQRNAGLYRRYRGSECRRQDGGHD